MSTAEPRSPPTKFGVILFPGFQALDVFGPLDALSIVSRTMPLEQHILAATLDPVSTCTEAGRATIGQSVVPTHTLQTAPEDIEVLLVPGGMGTRDTTRMEPIVEYLKATYPKLRFLLTVCTGSAVVARAGVLDGREATSNKIAFEWVKTQGPNVKWVRQARWVTDGNIWTSSGITAGIDMMYAFIADQFGEHVAADVARQSEYVRDKDASKDPFAA